MEAQNVHQLPPGPRRQFPGQLILRFRRDPLEFFTSLARDYGDIVHFRLGRLDHFFLNQPDYIHQVLVTHADRFTKGPALQRASTTLGQGLLTSEGEFHKRQRRLAQPVFHAQRVSAYAAAMVEQARHLRDAWRPGLVLDIHEQMMELALRIVADALFGSHIENEIKQISHAMTVNVQMFSRAMMPWGQLLRYLPLPSNFRYWHARSRLYDTIDHMVRQRRQSNADRQDFLSLLLRPHDTEGNTGTMTDTQLRDEAITIFAAGHETTANALTFAWYLLATHPDARAYMEQEIDQVLHDRLPAAADVPHLRYTRAVFAESMRLYPPAWALARRATASITLGPYTIPAGSIVLMSQWVMHRDARYWPDAAQFIPDRWLVDSTSRPRYAYFPFGGGPRGCIGEPFAWLEGILVLATLAQRWRLDPQTDQPPALQPTITLRPRHPIRLLATPVAQNP